MSNFENEDAFLKEQKAKLDEQMESQIAGQAASGNLDPVEGIDIDTWAAGNAKIANGMSVEEVLTIVGTEKPLWDKASAEWNARMSQDTSATIATVYGNAFVNSNIGKFASAGAEAEAKPAQGSTSGNIMEDFELYVKVMAHMGKGAEQGQDPQSILAIYGANLTDWASAGGHWTAQISTNTAMAMQMAELMGKYNAEFEGAGAGDDIDF